MLPLRASTRHHLMLLQIPARRNLQSQWRARSFCTCHRAKKARTRVSKPKHVGLNMCAKTSDID